MTTITTNFMNVLNPQFSGTLQKNIDLYGNYKIIEYVKICRNPLDQFVKKALDVITLGKFSEIEKQHIPTENFYHLFMQLVLSDGGKTIYMQLEKNEVISIKVQNQPFKAVESESLKIVKNDMTFQTLIYLTQNRMGNSDFIKYDPITNNCQNFVLNLTKTICQYQYNVSVPKTLEQFIYQPVQEILKKFDTTKKIMKTVTNLAGAAKRLWGKGLKH